MSLPVRNDILTMDFSKDGGPWVNVASKSGIDLDGLDWSKDGSPWWGIEFQGATHTATFTLDAIIKATKTATFTIDAIIQTATDASIVMASFTPTTYLRGRGR